MPREYPSPTGADRIRDILGLSSEKVSRALSGLSFDTLMNHTRRQLLECARLLGLSGIHGLTKNALARRFVEALQALVPAEREEPADRARKFDLGRSADEGPDVEQIPWSYGQNRVTAMVVDSARLYVYWETTDEVIARAREGLGAGGRDAWLDLRVYDVTGRIFDGTNAHHYFDHRIDRSDRQWFFHVGRPGSTAVVEIGLKSQEGYFVHIARSGRADFPREEPAPPGGVEWLTVRAASGEIGEPAPGTPAVAAPALGDRSPHVEPVRVWDIRRTHGGERLARDESFRTEWESAVGWLSEAAVAWEGPVLRTTWEAGPFSFPVPPPGYVEERHAGPVTVHTSHGRTRVVHGPWQVVIRGLGARAERKVLAVWEVYRSWSSTAGAQVQIASSGERASASEQRLGASERRWLAGSEIRLGGASELYAVGASELRYLGASESIRAGASEWRYVGGSEWRFVGASEWRAAGASELRYAGASEHRGASEALHGYPRPHASGSDDGTR